jgi:hypothetical protein
VIYSAVALMWLVPDRRIEKALIESEREQTARVRKSETRFRFPFLTTAHPAQQGRRCQSGHAYVLGCVSEKLRKGEGRTEVGRCREAIQGLHD